MSWTIDQNHEGITGFKRFIGVMEAEPAIKDILGAKPFIFERGEIQFEDVSFQYGDSQTPGSRWVVCTYPSTVLRAKTASLQKKYQHHRPVYRIKRTNCKNCSFSGMPARSADQLDRSICHPCLGDILVEPIQ